MTPTRFTFPASAQSANPRLTGQATSTGCLGNRVVGQDYWPDLITNPRKKQRPNNHITDHGEADANVPGLMPWHCNDMYLSQLKEGDFLMLTQPQTHIPEGLMFGNDITPIHPFFRGIADHVPDIPLLSKALRLATRFITSRHTLSFIHNLITARPTILADESLHLGANVLHLPAPSYQPLSDHDTQLTINTLIALVDHIEFSFPADPRLTNTWAFTTRFPDPSIDVDSPNQLQHTITTQLHALSPCPADLKYFPTYTLTPQQSHLLSLQFTGTNALIRLSPSFLRVIHPSTHPSASASTQLNSLFHLAVTLVHEVCHAVVYTRFAPPPTGVPEYEPFVGNDRQSEVGHAWEKEVFGGAILPLGQATPIMPVERRGDWEIGVGVQRWPGVAEVGCGGGKILARRREGKWVTGGRWDEVRVLGWEWVRRWFCRDWWEVVEIQGRAVWDKELMARGLVARRENADWGCLEGGEPVDWVEEGGWSDVEGECAGDDEDGMDS